MNIEITEKQNLLSQNTEFSKYQKLSFFQQIKQHYKQEDSNQIIKPFQKSFPQKLFPQTNKLKNTKYSIFNFLPLFLYLEFSQFSNLYYLLLCLTQFYPPLEVGFKISYLLPILVILCFRGFEELSQHYKTKQKDEDFNNSLYLVAQKNENLFQFKKAQEIRVGDLIKITDKIIPVDLIILSSLNESIFISTTQLDGETDLKVRNPLVYTQQRKLSNLKLLENPIEIQLNQEIVSLNDFQGVLKVLDEKEQIIQQKEYINIRNTIWSGCSVSNNEIYGIVIGVGQETRLRMNSSSKKIYKTTLLDNRMNKFTLILFLMMLSLGIINSILSGSINFGYKIFLITIIRYVILLSFLIPISLKLFLIAGRLSYCEEINQDKEIPNVQTKNGTIVDDLGTIEIILSDKTGTITKNQMKMDQVFFQNKEIKVENKFLLSQIQDLSQNEFFQSIALCNNVLMDKGADDQNHFEASSPDEIAMVEFVEEIGFKFIKKDNKEIYLQLPNHQIKKFQVLQDFPFESTRKRMGVILQNENEEIIFYLKGADSVIKKTVNNKDDQLIIDEKSYNLASQGLRTLCFVYKKLTLQQYQNFKNQFQQASLQGSLRAIQEIDKFEDQMTFLGITGVKDILQDNVVETFSYFKEANLKTWILTGDKMETAIHICKSIGIANRNTPIEIFEFNSKNDYQNKISKKFQSSSMNQYSRVLIIDGESLQEIFDFDSIGFLNFCILHKFVCITRCSPLLKYLITFSIKNSLQKRVLCIGDGGNDVGMIQASTIGIGIQGKEGNQAALASDFVIEKFKDISKLLLFYGRKTHIGLSQISHFILHRGLIISWIQELFMVTFYMLSLPVYSGILMVTYSSVFTILPVFSVIKVDDLTWDQLKQYLFTYRYTKKAMSYKNFLIWNFISLYQGVTICIGGFLFFNNFLQNFVEITFTSLILAESFNIILLIPQCTLWLFISISGTLLLYFICIISFPKLFQIDLINLEFFSNVFKIFLISWLPIFVGQKIYKNYNKEVSDIVQLICFKNWILNQNIFFNNQ